MHIVGGIVSRTKMLHSQPIDILYNFQQPMTQNFDASAHPIHPETIQNGYQKTSLPITALIPTSPL